MCVEGEREVRRRRQMNLGGRPLNLGWSFLCGSIVVCGVTSPVNKASTAHTHTFLLPSDILPERGKNQTLGVDFISHKSRRVIELARFRNNRERGATLLLRAPCKGILLAPPSLLNPTTESHLRSLLFSSPFSFMFSMC